MILKRTNSEDNILFLHLKIKKNRGKWYILDYDKRKDLDFNIKSLTNWFSYVSRKAPKNVMFLQISRVRYICNNETDLKIALEDLKRTLQVIF